MDDVARAMTHDKKARHDLSFVSTVPAATSSSRGVEPSIVRSSPRTLQGRIMSGVILLLSGPNLDLLGERTPEIYGTTTLAEHVDDFTLGRARRPGSSCATCSRTLRGTSSRRCTTRGATAVAIVVNAGALTHTSWALADALARFDGVKVEVHLSNPAAREPYRHVSTLGRSRQRLDRRVWRPELRPRA